MPSFSSMRLGLTGRHGSSASPPRRLRLQSELKLPSHAPADTTRTPYLTTPTPKLNDRFLALETSPSRPSLSLWPSVDQFTGKRADGRSKFGRWLIFLVFSSIFLLLIAIGFLSWIWFGNPDTIQWRQLMTGPYNARSITISGVSIRYSIATLAWITVAMMASIIVEQQGVPRESIAEASVARYTGAIIPLVLRPYALRGWWFRVLLPLQLICGISSQFSSTLLFSDFDAGVVRGFDQQASVFFDFMPKVTQDSDGKEVIESDSEHLPDTQFFFSWQNHPQAAEAFAEYSEPENRVKHPQVDDTGPAWRAFLPIDDSAIRSSITDYRGRARVFDARVVCTNPNIASLSIEKADGSNSYTGEGSFDARIVPDLLQNENETIDFSFICPMSDSDCSTPVPADGSSACPETAPVWQKCAIRSPYNDLMGPTLIPSRMSTLDPVFYKLDQFDEADAQYYADPSILIDPDTILDDDDEELNKVNLELNKPSTRMRRNHVGFFSLLINAAIPLEDSGGGNHAVFRDFFDGNLDRVPDVTIPLQVQPSTEESYWQNVQAQSVIPPGLAAGLDLSKQNQTALEKNFSISTRATLCFDVMLLAREPVRYFDIHATADSNRSEPRQNWIQGESRYNITGVLRQLGVTKENLTSSERGILSISRESILDNIDNMIKPIDLISASSDSILPDFAQSSLKERNSLVLCAVSCSPPVGGDNVFVRTDQYWGDLFSRVLNESDSAALAIQSINTVKARMDYMGFVPAYTASSEATMAGFTTVQVPTRTSGFTTVMCIIGLQVAIFTLSWIRFRKVHDSILSNAWLVISQVASSPETADILAQAATMTDAEVTKYVSTERDKWPGREASAEEAGRSTGICSFVARDGTFRRKLEGEDDMYDRRSVWTRVHARSDSVG